MGQVATVTRHKATHTPASRPSRLLHQPCPILVAMDEAKQRNSSSVGAVQRRVEAPPHLRASMEPSTLKAVSSFGKSAQTKICQRRQHRRRSHCQCRRQTSSTLHPTREVTQPETQGHPGDPWAACARCLCPTDSSPTAGKPVGHWCYSDRRPSLTDLRSNISANHQW